MLLSYYAFMKFIIFAIIALLSTSFVARAQVANSTMTNPKVYRCAAQAGPGKILQLELTKAEASVPSPTGSEPDLGAVVKIKAIFPWQRESESELTTEVLTQLALQKLNHLWSGSHNHLDNLEELSLGDNTFLNLEVLNGNDANEGKFLATVKVGYLRIFNQLICK